MDIVNYEGQHDYPTNPWQQVNQRFMQAPTWGAIGTLPKTNMLQTNNNPIINYDFSQPLIDETILHLQVNARAHAHTHTRFSMKMNSSTARICWFCCTFFSWSWSLEQLIHLSFDSPKQPLIHELILNCRAVTTRIWSPPRNYLVPSAPYNERLFCCSHFWLLHHSSQAISFLYSCSQDISTAKEPLSERSLRQKFQVPNFVVFGERQSLPRTTRERDVYSNHKHETTIRIKNSQTPSDATTFEKGPRLRVTKAVMMQKLSLCSSLYRFTSKLHYRFK